MLKTLLGALGAARNMLASDTSLIRQGLAGLDRIDSTLAARAAAFVAEGSNETVLLDLRARGPGAGLLLGNPGRLFWNFYGAPKEDDAAIRAGMAARNTMYERIDPAAPATAMLVRLGQLFEAADQRQKLDRAGSAAPDWLQYLLNDALWACRSDPGAPPQQPQRPAWDVRLLAAILAEAGLPAAMALSIVFERQGVSQYHRAQVYQRLLAPGALDEYMLADPDAVAFAAKTLSATGRVVLCERIGTSAPLRARYAPLLVQMAVGESKTTRDTAALYLDALDPSTCTGLLAGLLRGGQTAERANAAQLLARLQGADAVAALDAALADEKARPVQQAIRAALSRLQAAGDASGVELPEPPALYAFEETMLADDALQTLLANREELLARLRQGAEEEDEYNLSAKHKASFRRHHYNAYTTLSESDLQRAVRALNGDAASLPLLSNASVLETLEFGNRLEARADFGVMQLMRWLMHLRGGSERLWWDPRFQRWLQRQDASRVDLRQIAGMAALCGGAEQDIGLACLRQHVWSGTLRPQEALPADRVWPYFAAHPELIDEGLGMAGTQRASYEQFDTGCALSVLETFPVVPARWLPRVMELALGEGKTFRLAAQRVLDKLPDVGARVCEALGSGKQELRIEAARWLARLGYRPAIAPLYAALDKETRETASAELMTALEKLGEDLSPRLAPDILLRQARKGLKGKPPAGLAWLDLGLLPACRWAGGEAAEPDIIRWWVVLACKLKEPAGNALLERYMGLLDQPSRAALGGHLLHQFIAHDTAHPALEQAIAWANQHAPARYQQYQQMARQYPQYYGEAGKLTPEQVFEQVKREKLGEYLGSAIGEKGILALTFGMPGHALVAALQQYMRDHYPRRAQVEAMLEAACLSNEPVVIQFVLGVARRYRTASVQEKARLLVGRIAERNGWTADELADRTIPTGGLDENGCLALQYGARAFTVTLDAALKPVLRNAEGKVVGALPAPRQDDAPESVKEAKQLLAACKKEVKQVLDMQRSRLYDAMCAGRAWPAAQWNEYLFRHPVAGRLVQRLVWAELDEGGAVVRLFRPTEDGSLIDSDDEQVVPGDGARVCVAHASMLEAGQARAWLAHFKDYKVAPLFAQLDRPAPALPHAGAERIDDRLGWTSDAFTLRGAFGKLGYQRGQGEDGGVFFEYLKDFTGAGLRACIEFSGNALPEENLPAALKSLSFRPLPGRGQAGAAIALHKVPPVLLAEAYADYHAVAAACHGFDPEWERKMPW